MAQWSLDQGGGSAMAETRAGGYTFRMSCEAGRGAQVYFGIRAGGSGDPDLAAAQSAMLWIKLPDGRTDRWPVTLSGTARGAGGPHPVSDFNLDFFRNATSMEVELYPQRKTLAVLPMRGSGAARLAFLEQCGI
ncbi:hypothetical protein MWU52_16040 [Jannaschia sp. S6380]|uniref:hypothetical protein n=1 Tax=Jannaschia sp. S6380 TaxID=2926408 RepID=UPI001FF1CE05|nr:hypothetical protein [Jannaschia sp. S6380]MCK0169066.1 hypothetical protein [Jannaschia sp. S6380]